MIRPVPSPMMARVKQHVAPRRPVPRRAPSGAAYVVVAAIGASALVAAVAYVAEWLR